MAKAGHETAALRHAVREQGLAQLDKAPRRLWRRLLPEWSQHLLWTGLDVRYDAFLSYSWSSDREVAPVLQSTLQRFLCPWYKLRARRVFRDLSALPAGSSLEEALFDRLDRSRHFVLLASPEAGRSAGVELEAHHWFSRPREGAILVIVTAGEGRTWHDIREVLLPPSARSNLSCEPVWIDLRHHRAEILARPRGRELTARLVECLRQVFLRLYEPLTWEELQGEERTQRRKAKRLVALVVLLLLAFASSASLSAWQARRNERKAELALARALVQAGADLVGQNRPGEAAAYFARALRTAPESIAATSWLSDQLLHRAWWTPDARLVHDNAVYSAEFSGDGRRLLTQSSTAARVWDAASGSPIGPPLRQKGKMFFATFSPDGRYVATASGTDDGSAQIW